MTKHSQYKTKYTQDMPSGGKREGAGRKTLPVGQKKIDMTIKVKPEVAKKLRERAKQENTSVGTLIENLL